MSSSSWTLDLDNPEPSMSEFYNDLCGKMCVCIERMKEKGMRRAGKEWERYKAQKGKGEIDKYFTGPGQATSKHPCQKIRQPLSCITTK